MAARLALEGTRRQVIVFSHDMYFLLLIQQEAAKLGQTVKPYCLERTPDGFGVQSADAPFSALPTTARVRVLRDAQVGVKRADSDHDDRLRRKLTREAYGDLRDAWEHAVEEVLLADTVVRSGEGVSHQSAEVRGGHRRRLEDRLYRCVALLEIVHDASAMAGLGAPTPNDLRKDIEDLESWRSDGVKRREATGKLRKQMVKGES